MNLSLGEFQAVTAKALRGAGYTWGMAAEGAAACRTLASMGIDPSTNLLRLLAAVSDLGIDSVRPDATWRTTSGRVCPLSVGAAISDAPPSDGHAVQGLLEPLLVVPGLAACATNETAFEIRWQGGGVIVGADGPTVWAIPPVADVVIEPTSAPDRRRTRATRIDVDGEILQRLNDYAHRTYAPSTEASRQAGAGAGLNDND